MSQIFDCHECLAVDLLDEIDQRYSQHGPNVKRSGLLHMCACMRVSSVYRPWMIVVCCDVTTNHTNGGASN